MRLLVAAIGITAIAGVAGFVWFRRASPESTTTNAPRTVNLTRYSGRMLDHLGRPVGGVEVKASALLHSVSGRTQTLSQRNGRFSVDLPDDNPPRVTLRKPGYVPQTIDLLQSEMGEHEYRFRRSAVLNGTVFERDGPPIPNASVEVRARGGWTERATTGPDGRFRIDAPPGAVVVAVHSARFADRLFLDVTLDRDEPTQWVGELERGGGARFRILDHERPLSGAKISIRTANGDLDTATTDASGVAAINGLGGPVIEYAVTRSGYGDLVDRASLESANDVVELTLRLEAMDPVAFELSSPSGTSLEIGRYDRLRVTRRGHELVNASLDDLGARHVLRSGVPYEIEISIANHATFHTTASVPADDAILRVTIPVGARILGIAIDTNGDPVPGALLMISAQDRPGIGIQQTGRTTVAGLFRTWKLTPGPIHVRLQHESAGVWSKNVELSNEELDLGPVTLEVP